MLLLSKKDKNASFLTVLALSLFLLACFQSRSGEPLLSSPPPALISDTPARRMTETSHSWPSIAWLVSFPGSGEDSVMETIHTASGTTSATNYGTEILSTMTGPKVAYGSNGPYRFNDLPFSDRYILTETHCGGFCLDCPQMYSRDTKAFFEACTAGRNANGRRVGYDAGVVKKGVHIFRNPFDTIANRFENEYKKNAGVEGGEWRYTNDPAGFKEWCRYLDSSFAQREAKWSQGEAARLAISIPCHGLLYQFIQWHNNAFGMFDLTNVGIEMAVMHYEDFQKNPSGFTSRLLEYLELPPMTTAPSPSLEITTYPGFFSDFDRSIFSSFLKVTASEQSWVHLKTYLPPPLMESVYQPLGALLSPQHYGTWPGISWLLSFPNSGTGFTRLLTQVRSRATTATNYAQAVGEHFQDIPNFAYTVNGPYRYSRRPFPKGHILTTTHCSGHCSECLPDEYVVSASDYLSGCAAGWKSGIGGKMESKSYNPNIVRKVVHLIRNPFDNIVARFHYAYKDHIRVNDNMWVYSYNSVGFKRWCEDSDQRYANENWYRDEEIVSLAKRVPCHNDFYQFVQWHNNAFEVPETLNVPSLVVHYEEYENLDHSASKLFEFLEIPQLGQLPKFTLQGYPDYFSEEEYDATVLFIQKIASPKTYENLMIYFGSKSAKRSLTI